MNPREGDLDKAAAQARAAEMAEKEVKKKPKESKK